MFRTGFACSWLVSLLHVAMHGAASEIRAGNLTRTDAASVIAASVLAAYTAPGGTVPGVEEWLPA